MFNKKKNELILDCPGCNHQNSFQTQAEFKCQSCDAEIGGVQFVKKKFQIPARYLFWISAACGAGTVSVLSDDRLPYAAEYILMDSCISNDRRVISTKIWKNKAEVCGCIIEEALERVGTGRDRNEPDEVIQAFGTAMRSATSECVD